MTRILHIIPSLEHGGAERILSQLVTAERPAGSKIEQRVIALMSANRFGDDIKRHGVPLDVYNVNSLFDLVQLLSKVKRTIKDWRPDVIQSWLYYADLCALFALKMSGRREQTRLYWGVRCSDLDFSQYRPILRIAVALAAKLSGQPDAIVANSQAGLKAHIKLGYRPDKMLVIPNGTNTSHFRPDPAKGEKIRQELGLSPQERVVIHLARLDPQKDHKTLIAVAALLPEITFISAGRGTLSLKGTPNIRFLGERTDASALLNAADLVLSTSAFAEGFPNVIAEGMACGKPAVSTDCGDAVLIVGEAGKITPRGDAQALAAAIGEIFAMPQTERLALGERARNRIDEHFAFARCIERFDALHMTGSVPEMSQAGASLASAT